MRCHGHTRESGQEFPLRLYQVMPVLLLLSRGPRQAFTRPSDLPRASAPAIERVSPLTRCPPTHRGGPSGAAARPLTPRASISLVS
jgi:hypothetical protein